MTQIKDLLQKHGFQFSKRFGQNFISDGNLLDSIVTDAGVQSTDAVLEIGCGAGTLTARLAEKAARVVGYEIDTALRPVLSEYLGGFNNVELRYYDFLQEPPEKLTELCDARVVANLPYYITTPVILRLLENGIGKSITVMVQREVADRLVAKAGSKNYGAITVKVALTGKARITRTVSRNLFYPVPNVDSAVVTIERNEVYRGKDSAFTEQVVRSAFAMRRKTLTNNLLGIISDKSVLCACFEQLGLKPDCRGETLSPEQFVQLADALWDIRKQS